MFFSRREKKPKPVIDIEAEEDFEGFDPEQKRLSVAERIFHMESQAEESKFTVSAPRSLLGSGTSTPKGKTFL